MVVVHSGEAERVCARSVMEYGKVSYCSREVLGLVIMVLIWPSLVKMNLPSAMRRRKLLNASVSYSGSRISMCIYITFSWSHVTFTAFSR